METEQLQTNGCATKDGNAFVCNKLDELDEEENEENDEFDYKDESDLGAEMNGEKEKIVLARNETRAVCFFRSILFSVLVGTAIAVSLGVYTSSRRTEIEDFESEFIDQGRKLVDAFRSNAKRRLKAIDGFSNDITSYAVHSGSTWPNVTFPGYERHGNYTLDLAEVLSVTFVVFVSGEIRAEWETYSVNNQGWLRQSLETQVSKEGKNAASGREEENLDVLDSIIGDSSELQIPPAIWKFSEEDDGPPTTAESGSGPFAAWWQYAPAFPVSSIVNFNLMSNPTRTQEIMTVLRTKQAVTSRCFDISDDTDQLAAARQAGVNLFLTRWKSGGNEFQDGPMSDLYIPVFDHHGQKQSVAGLLTSYVYWQAYFTEVLPENANGVMAILENTCGQSYTYLINGPQAEYVGSGDMHDAKYDPLEMATGFGAFLNLQPAEEDIHLLEGQCIYNVRVYPTSVMEEQYMTQRPLMYAISLLLTFAFTSFIFLLYDYIVERRQRIVMKTAVQSTEVVQSLFPAVVRDRLYEESRTPARNTGPDNGNFLLEEQQESQLSTMSRMAIADLYMNCTVLFADIRGFTSWSSEREPTHVFHLLETLYGAFDKLARKHKVFKIETIGDCYLAVTGLPEPQEDHAVIMTKFAARCLTKMNQLKHDLTTTLGPETVDLDMRFGLHSGPVTAGVLRGEKARFQLFGDTVNTAARMESTGLPGKIQASLETADILISMGKQDWVREREDLVEAKGKGTLRTYWLEPQLDRAHSTVSSRAEF